MSSVVTSMTGTAVRSRVRCRLKTTHELNIPYMRTTMCTRGGMVSNVCIRGYNFSPVRRVGDRLIDSGRIYCCKRALDNDSLILKQPVLKRYMVSCALPVDCMKTRSYNTANTNVMQGMSKRSSGRTGNSAYTKKSVAEHYSNRRKGRRSKTGAGTAHSKGMSDMVDWLVQRDMSPKDLLGAPSVGVHSSGDTHRASEAKNIEQSDPAIFDRSTGIETSTSDEVRKPKDHSSIADLDALSDVPPHNQQHVSHSNYAKLGGSLERTAYTAYEKARDAYVYEQAARPYVHDSDSDALNIYKETPGFSPTRTNSSLDTDSLPRRQPLNPKEAVVHPYVHEHLRVAATSHNWFLMLQILSDLKDDAECQGVDTEAMYSVMDSVKYMPLTDAVNVSRKLFQVCNAHITHFRRLPDTLTKLEDLMQTFVQIEMVYWAEQAFIWATDRPATKFIDAPRQRTYNLLLECISKRKSPLKVYDVVNEMKLRGIEYNLDTVTHVFKDCYKRRRGDHALTFFYLDHVRGRATAQVYTLCLEALIHGRRLNPDHEDAVQAFVLLNEMASRAFVERREDLRPTLSTYKVVYTVTDLKGQNELYRRMRRENIRLDYEFVCKRMDILLDPQFPEVRTEQSAMDVITTFRDAQVRHRLFTDPSDGREDLGSKHWALYEHGHYKLVQALSFLYMYDEATDVYAALVKQDIPLRSQTVSACLYAHAHARKWDELGPLLTRFWDQNEVAGPHLTRSLPDVCMMMAQERGKDAAFALWIHHQDMLNECIDPTWISRVQVATIDAMMNEANPVTPSEQTRIGGEHSHASARDEEMEKGAMGEGVDDDMAGVAYDVAMRQRRTASAQAVRHEKRMRQPGVRWHTYKKERRRLNLQVLHDKRIADKQAENVEWGVVDTVHVDEFERPKVRKKMVGDDKRIVRTRHVPKWTPPEQDEQEQNSNAKQKGTIGGIPPTVVL